MKYSLILLLIFLSISCSNTKNQNAIVEEEIVQPPNFYYGADLSYVNEMEDCGVIYKDASNIIKNPYAIFKEAGTNIVRVRLWHNPTWTHYSNYEDVKETILKAKTEGITFYNASNK